MRTSRDLSPFVHNDFRIGTVAAILTNKNKVFICDNAVTAVRICLLNLVSQIDIGIFPKPDRRPVGKGIRQVYIRSGQQIQVCDSKSLDAESVDFLDQPLLQGREVFVSLRNAAAAEGMSLALFTASAGQQPVTFFTAVVSAIREHMFYPSSKPGFADFFLMDTTVSIDFQLRNKSINTNL
jgi:hypothetical protein